jgi:hypothetical protein
MSVTTRDPAVIRAELERQGAMYPAALRAALYQMGFKGVELATPLTPVAPIYGGTLRGSYYVTPPTEDGAGNVTVTFGPGTEYARRRHFEGPRAGGPGVVRYLQVAKDQLERQFLQGMLNLTKRNARSGAGVGALSNRGGA